MSTERVIATEGLVIMPGAPCPQLELSPEPHAAPAARAWVREQTPPLNDDQCLALELLTTELVTNAVIHARTRVTLGVTTLDQGILVTVSDRNLDLPEPQPHSETGANGRGLVILESMARRWGISRHEDGKTVWFVLDRREGRGSEDDQAPA